MADTPKTRKPGRVKAAILNWLGVPVSLTTGEFWRELGATSSSGQAVNVDKALQLSAVWACVRLLSETVSTLPLKLYRRGEDGSREAATDHPMYALLCQRPNAEMTPARFMLLVIASICLRGNAFIEKRRIGARIVALHPLLPQNVTVKRLPTGRLEYTYTEEGSRRVIPERDIVHIRGFGLDGVTGMMPVNTGKEVIGSAIAADEASSKVFAQGLQASGFLSTDKTLTKDQREDLREKLTAFQGSKNAGKLMVAEAGLKYEGITMDPEAAQMLETRSFNVEEICRWWRVPPFMVGHTTKQSSWASSVEGMNLQFLTNTLRPLIENIEQELNMGLLGGDHPFFFEFAVEGLLRTDTKGRAEFYASAAQNGYMNRNEIRRRENQPPFEGGDIFTVQSNLVPIDKLGEVQEAANRVAASWMAGRNGSTD